MEDLIFYPQWQDMMIELDKKPRCSLSKMSVRMGVSYAHFIRIINRLEECGLVISNKYGRIRLTDLTEKGKDVKDYLIQVKMRARQNAYR